MDDFMVLDIFFFFFGSVKGRWFFVDRSLIEVTLWAAALQLFALQPSFCSVWCVGLVFEDCIHASIAWLEII